MPEAVFSCMPKTWPTLDITYHVGHSVSMVPYIVVYSSAVYGSVVYGSAVYGTGCIILKWS